LSGAGSKNLLSEAPTIHAGAVVEDFEFGAWTEVGRGTLLKAGSMGDWSYETYKAAIPDIRALDIDAFIEKHGA